MFNLTLVTGGTGKTGRRIAAKLTALDIPVRIGSRSAMPAFDWYNSTTWATALKNVSSVYISFQPDLAIPAAASIIKGFVDACKQENVQKLVLLSGRGEHEAEVCEQLVINSGIDYTVLRASWFNQNFNENYLLENVLAGAVEMPAGNIPEPFIDADDIAEAAVAALTNLKHSNKLYEITGPELLTFRQAFEIIASETGKPISFRDLSIDEYRELLKQYQTPDDFIEMIIYLYAEVMDGRNSSVTHDLEKLISGKPKTFRDFVKENPGSLSATVVS